MAFVDGYENDIFVSYAHVDDQAPPGAQEGWVTTFMDGLKVLLAMQLGRADSISMWWDCGLARHVPVSGEITQGVQTAAVLLVFLSEGYLASDWCGKESSGFLSAAGESSRRLFVIERMPIERSRKPALFQNVLGYPFWTRRRVEEPARTLGFPTPRPDEQEYFVRLHRLAVELAAELGRMRAERRSAAPAS